MATRRTDLERTLSGLTATIRKVERPEPSAVVSLPFRASDPSPFARAPDAESRREAIAKAAYFLAERRGFTPGHELEDWMRAEQEVDARRWMTET
jgi:hypothetical protein